MSRLSQKLQISRYVTQLPKGCFVRSFPTWASSATIAGRPRGVRRAIGGQFGQNLPQGHNKWHEPVNWDRRAAVTRPTRILVESLFERSEDASQIFGGVDVVGAAGVTTFDRGHQLGVGPQERAGARVAGGGGQHLGPMGAVDEHRV